MAEITSTDYLKALLPHYELEDIRDAVQGARTDEEAKYLIQKALLGVDAEGNILPAMKPEVAELTKDWPKRENQITVPFTTQVLKDLGYPMDKESIDSSYAQFVKDYPRKKEGFKSILSGKPYGSHGYADEILQNAFRAAVKDRAQADLQKLRDDAMSAHLEDPYSWYGWAIGHTLLRNMYKAGQEGRDPTLADVASDAAEDILFAVPGGTYAVPVKAAVAKAGLGKAGSYAARILGESVAPFANEAAQYGLHSSDALEETGINPGDEDMFHEQERTSEATFSPERAVMGALTNNAVGIGMYRAGSKAAPVLTGELTRGANSKALREGVMGAETAGDVIRNAENVAKNAKKFKSENGFNSFLAGESKSLDKAAMSDAEGVLRFKAKAKELKVPEDIPSYVDNFDGYVETLLDHNGITGGERELFKRTLKAHPQLATLIKTTDKGVKTKRLLNSALSNSGAARSEIVNKYGSQKEANIATGLLGIGGKQADELAKLQDERILKNKRAIENQQILAKDGLDETDKKYLEKVFKNPKMLQFDSNADTGFKLWLVTRGNDILRGTSYFRPAFAVEEK